MGSEWSGHATEKETAMFRLSVLAIGFGMSIAFSAGLAAAQSLFTRNHPQTKTISVDMSRSNLDVPKPVTVNNGSTVQISVQKSPIHSCDVKFTTESVPKPDILGQIFSLVAPFAGRPAGFAPEGAPSAIDRPLNDVLKALEDTIGAALKGVQTYADVSKELDQFAKCRDSDGNDICSRRAGELDDAAAIARVTAAKGALETHLAAAVDLPPVDFSVIEGTAATLEQRLLARAADVNAPPDPQWLSWALRRLNEDKGILTLLGPQLQNLASVSNLLKKVQPMLSSLVPSFTWSHQLPPISNRLLKGTLSCQNPFNQSSASVPLSVTYQNLPELTPTAGLLISFFSKRPIGIRSQSTPCSSGTGDNCIAVTSTSKTQMLPIGLGNAYLFGSRNLNFSLAGGVGLNLNNGATQVEYFTGLSFAVHGFYLTPGLHIARVPQLAGGLVLGQAAPAGVSSSTLPITFHTALHFGIVLSHAAAPTPKPSSN